MEGSKKDEGTRGIDPRGFGHIFVGLESGRAKGRHEYEVKWLGSGGEGLRVKEGG